MRRREKLAVGEVYHIFNRGVEKRDIFLEDRDYQRFIETLIFFNTEKPSWLIEDRPRVEEELVEAIAYCLNPNHFHLLLREKKENGITDFMRKICTGYAMYFNQKYDHSGVLFQGRFKSVHIGSNEHLLYVSAYVNCNSQIHGIKNAIDYPWCSFSEYLGKEGMGCQKQILLGQFKSPDDYRDFCLEKAAGMKKKKEDEKYAHLLLEK